jgi:ADP-ribose pyrophosphatase YjhB (NUDIX family)
MKKCSVCVQHRNAENRQGQKGKRERMSSWREYPERPIVGVGGVVIENGRALLIRRGTEPLLGQWSIPGGTLELGETLAEGTARELKEETGLEVDVLELIEVFERINFGHGADESWTTQEERRRPRFHFVIVDFLCERTAGSPIAGGDVTDVAWAAEDELDKFAVTPTATRVICKAFSLARLRK